MHPKKRIYALFANPKAHFPGTSAHTRANASPVHTPLNPDRTFLYAFYVRHNTDRRKWLIYLYKAVIVAR